MSESQPERPTFWIVLSIVLGITIGLMDWLLQLIFVDGIARLAR